MGKFGLYWMKIGLFQMNGERKRGSDYEFGRSHFDKVEVSLHPIILYGKRFYKD